MPQPVQRNQTAIITRDKSGRMIGISIVDDD
jgi:hypothetical protein